jgi:hypothetical protein
VIERNLREDAIILSRVVAIMVRRGLVPTKPPSLQGIPIQIKFVSKLALLQQAAKTAGMERTLAMGGKMEAIMPGTLDEINNSRYIHEYGEAVEFPADVWSTDDEKKQKAQARAQAMKQAQQQHAATETAPAMADAAHTLSQTDTGGGINALQMMLGGGQGARPQ